MIDSSNYQNCVEGNFFFNKNMVGFTDRFIELVKQLLSTPKVPGSNPREAQKFSKAF